MLKNVFAHIFKQKLALAQHMRSNGFDVNTLETTKALTGVERAERYRTGRFAEMADDEAKHTPHRIVGRNAPYNSP